MNKSLKCILFFFLLIIELSISAQQPKYIEIKGEVVDKLYKPVSFVNIASKKTGLGTISRENGTFRIRIMEDDTLVFSALSYIQKEISVKYLLPEMNYVKLEKSTYQLKEIDVLGVRWQEFRHEMLNKELAREEESVLKVEALPDPFQKRIELGPYAGSSNPLSMFLTYIKKENIRTRKQKRWKKTYRKSWIETR